MFSQVGKSPALNRGSSTGTPTQFASNGKPSQEKRLVDFIVWTTTDWLDSDDELDLKHSTTQPVFCPDQLGIVQRIHRLS